MSWFYLKPRKSNILRGFFYAKIGTKMKEQTKKLAIFEGKKIRRYYDEKKELWFFSVVDVVGALTDQLNHKKAQSYWTTLKNRLKQEESEVVTKCDQLQNQDHT